MQNLMPILYAALLCSMLPVAQNTAAGPYIRGMQDSCHQRYVKFLCPVDDPKLGTLLCLAPANKVNF